MSDAPVCCRRGPTVLGRGVRVYWAASEGTHLVVWVTPDGRRRKRRLQSHTEAVDVAHVVVTQLGAAEAGEDIPPPPPADAGLTVPQFVERWVEDHRTARDWSLDYVNKLLGLNRHWVATLLDVPLASWAVADTVALFTVLERRERLSVSQRKHVLSMLRQAARYATQLGMLDKDPCLGIVVRGGTRSRRVTSVEGADGVRDYVEVADAPSTEAVELLAKHLADVGDDPLIVLLAGYCGCRWGETLALERGDIDLDDGTVRVVRRVDPKAHARNGDIAPPAGGHPRYWKTKFGFAAMPKSNRLRRTLLPDHLREMVKERPDGLLFPNSKGRYRTNGHHFDEGSFGLARERAGWPKGPDGRFLWTFHSLRHHAASWMLNTLRLPTTEVAALLGHADAAVTMRVYAHAAPDSAARAAQVARGWQPPPV